jgi:outer membrane biosynthesis protein TonB
MKNTAKKSQKSAKAEKVAKKAETPVVENPAIQEEAPVEQETPTIQEKAPVEQETPTIQEKAPVEQETPTIQEKAPEKEPKQETPKAEKDTKTPEQLQSDLAEARKNYKRTVEFLCTKTKTREVGIVRSARLDKRTSFIQYRIEIIAGPMMGQVFGKGNESKDLEWLS